ncbi:DUF3300 domain-containing protein [Colwellia psychrerythraea]|uniref:DUF3300 domain-containing protein n=1 Tax=Colwellia psychrerythraea TaxID=28229 RepID=A0A099L3Z9_COLPS|nr:DUF3300 domain-containing protein [Colwellia psychrerythraea]KGJ96887.1 Protein of unknown function DUF3300 [Colwellia psychrerythraea]
MNTHTKAWLNKLSILRLFFLSLTVISGLVLSTAAFSATSAEKEQQESVLSEAELAQTLAPIALYPDTLLTHILIASTYPIEVIEAERWLNKQSQLTPAQLERKSDKKEWDASIKALLAFPRVMAQLSEDLIWMQKLGDAFLQDEGRVLASIQTLRRQAEQAGSLADMDNVQVIKEQQVIILEPAQPEIIYVPYYDSRVVYGRWHWSHYPPVYWHNPHYYAAHYGPFYWGHGVHISSHFYFSAFHWHNRHVVVNHYNQQGYRARQKIVTSHHAKRWHHQPQHRRGVAYSSGRLKQKYYRAIIHSNSNIHRNNQRIVGSHYNLKLNNSTSQANRHNNFNAKLKVQSHQQKKPYNRQVSHKNSQPTKKYYAQSNHLNNKRVYKDNSNNNGHNVYKTHNVSSKSVQQKATKTKVHQPNNHRSNQRQSANKNSVRSGAQHKQKSKHRVN